MSELASEPLNTAPAPSLRGGGLSSETGTIIIGTGFSGLGMAIQLTKDRRDDFLLLEKASEVGGTWRDNTYPGCACDVPAHLYSYSFEQNPDWSRSFSGQPEIWRYLRRLTDKYHLRRHIRFGVEVTGARWDEPTNRWHVSTSGGEEYVSRFLVAGVGALHIPNIPALPGLETFTGRTFHSARWDHDYELRGKRVAVIGTGASAIQFVPAIVGDVARLDLYQRTPPWVLPRPGGPIPDRTRAVFRAVPPAQRLYRNAIYWAAESMAMGFNGNPSLLKAGEWLGGRHLSKQIKDRELRRKLVPRYTLGCKRVLGSNSYYPALARENVDVITDGITSVRPGGIVSGGVEREVDAIIFGTGFHVTDAFDRLHVVGRGGRDLATEWQRDGIQTHFGINVSGFPNLFFLLGPNTGLGHNSVVFMIESQIRYIAQAIRLTRRSRAEALEVRASVQNRFNEDIQRKLARGVWSTGGCSSWYLDSTGVNRTIWPGFTWRYWLQTRKITPADFELTGSRESRILEGASR